MKNLVFLLFVLLFSFSKVYAHPHSCEVDALERGLGVWVYALDDEKRDMTINYVKDYNCRVKEDKKIKYLYLSGGGVESADGYNGAYLYPQVDYDYYQSHLDGVNVYAMFESDNATANNLNGLPESELRSIAQQVADLVNDHDGIDGVHFDIEPFGPGQGKLIEYTQEYLDKPLGAALGAFTDDGFFGHLDIPVLMNYDQCAGDLPGFIIDTQSRADSFFELCRSYGNPNCHYGLAAVKSWCEPDDIDYYNASYNIFKGYEDESLGLTLYGLFTGEKPYPNELFRNVLMLDYEK